MVFSDSKKHLLKVTANIIAKYATFTQNRQISSLNHCERKAVTEKKNHLSLTRVSKIISTSTDIQHITSKKIEEGLRTSNLNYF